MPSSSLYQRWIVTLGIAVGVPILIVSLPGQSQSVKALQADDEAIRSSMVTISRQLGVECTTCHNTKNFGSGEKVEFRVAKEHMRLTQILIDNGMDGREKRPKADCYMCHRGTLYPAYKEKFDPLVMEKEKVKVPSASESPTGNE